MVTLALSVLLSASAQAQMLEPDLCMRSIGVATGATLAGRNWDLTTPGPVAFSASPSLWQGCQEDARWQWVTWFGFTAMPVYQHSYGGALNDRLPLLGLMTWGAGNEISYRTMIGGELVTNGLAYGVGFRMNTSFKTGIALRQGPDLRVRYLFGAEPELQVELLWRFPAHQTVMVPDDDHPPWLTGRIGYLQAGFEVGSLTAVHARFGSVERGVGLRLGYRTALRGDVALQPIALLFTELPLGGPRLLVNAGASYVDNEAITPAGGAAIGTAGKLFRGHAGFLMLVDLRDSDPTPRVGPDIGLSWTW